ncbi:MAG: septum formation initiator family protein [Desulfocapsaceae bacterium]|nr:septum formation initiator family protein [Desulfocapsaceae bacterium]
MKNVVVVGACLIAGALLWVIFAPRMGIYSLLHQRSTLAHLQVEYVEIQEKNAFLQKEIERIQNDPDYFEKVARDQYGLLKENEMVFEFPPSKKEKKDKKE